MRDGGFGSVCLGVLPQNVRAIAFYESLGFVRVKEMIWERDGNSFADLILIRDLNVKRGR